jgi:transposase
MRVAERPCVECSTLREQPLLAVESAKANGIAPHAYPSTIFQRLPCARNIEDFEMLLPWNVKAVRAV